MHDIFYLSSDLPTVDELLSYAIDSDVNKSSSIEGVSSQVCRDLLMHLPTIILLPLSTQENSPLIGQREQ